MLIADTAAVFVDAIFNQYQTYNGIAILGVLAYSAQLYADFSGGVDVVIGVAELFGVEMDENFKRPYFAVFYYRFLASLAYYIGNMDERLCILPGIIIWLDGKIR